jgi:hypothetical protein
MTFPTKNKLSWICIVGLIFGGIVFYPIKEIQADMWGGDIPLLIQIIAKTIEQIEELNQIISTTRQTVGVLEDMNSGIKEVLRLANTAHIPLPPQVYQQANTIAQATETARSIYGDPPMNAPVSTRTHFQSGTEALFLSQDAFDYSTFLDQTGENVKASSIGANQSAATRLTAETLGVVVEAISHTNRLEAKGLEISATDRLENSQKDAANYESFIETNNAIENGFRSYDAPDLNAFSWDDSSGSGPSNPGGVP